MCTQRAKKWQQSDCAERQQQRKSMQVKRQGVWDRSSQVRLRLVGRQHAAASCPNWCAAATCAGMPALPSRLTSPHLLI